MKFRMFLLSLEVIHKFFFSHKVRYFYRKFHCNLFSRVGAACRTDIMTDVDGPCHLRFLLVLDMDYDLWL